MRNCLFLVALLMVSQWNSVKAQSLFSAPDTVCIRQPVQLVDSIDASSYYWGFCSGYLLNPPVGENYGPDTNLHNPRGLEIVKDGNEYYGFVLNSSTSELVKLTFGTSLSDTPKITNLGNMRGTLPVEATDLAVFKDANGDWFIFVTGGFTQASSSIARVDYGKSLSNPHPNSVNFGNHTGLLNGPRGIIIEREGSDYIGFVANNMDNKLLRLNFGNNISFTPSVSDLGAFFGLAGPTDMILVKDNGDCHIFATNDITSAITRLDFGPSLSNNTPIANNLGNVDGKLFGPSSLTFVRDCDNIHLFVTNAVSSDLTRVDMPDVTSSALSASQFLGLGDMAFPNGISRVVREGDNLYTFVINTLDSSISRISFPQCTTVSQTSATTRVPPPYAYSEPGIYNIYLVVNEGLPDMRTECKQIVVLPLPHFTLTNDTVMCQGDTINMYIQAFGSLSQTWYPNYNISDTADFAITVWPEFTVDYHVVLPYANGCIVDTPVHVEVSKNRADAGPDRTIADGAKTVLGGPMTTESPQLGDPSYTYTWLPGQFIEDISVPNPVVSPPYDFTYYLEVRNSFGCYDIDTVVVHVVCADLNLPNAFAPESSTPGVNRFGIANRQVVKLNHFRVFDRWGKLVFETTDAMKQWDGTVNGEPAPYGVYVWEADGFCFEGQRFKRTGNVTLLR